MITNAAFAINAKVLGLEIPIIKAVAQVESRGSGFLQTGEPVILFEPHRFWANLVKSGINPKLFVKGNEDILYPVWGTRPYGKYSHQHSRLERAIKIDRHAALSSASWGLFQIMGENYKLAGFSALQDFITAMYKDEDAHLAAFSSFITNKKLVGYLKEHDWERFTAGYNGKGQVEKYSNEIKKAYEMYANQPIV